MSLHGWVDSEIERLTAERDAAREEAARLREELEWIMDEARRERRAAACLLREAAGELDRAEAERVALERVEEIEACCHEPGRP